MGGKIWVSNNKEAKVGDLMFLETLGVNAIISKVGMNFIWAQLESTNIILKLKCEVV